MTTKALPVLASFLFFLAFAFGQQTAPSAPDTPASAAPQATPAPAAQPRSKPGISFQVPPIQLSARSVETPRDDAERTPEERCHDGGRYPDGVVTDLHGADIHLYIGQIMRAIDSTWKPLMPKVVEKPFLKRGEARVCFAILPNGKVEPHSMVLTENAGDPALDRAAWGAVETVVLPPIPDGLNLPRLVFQIRFRYNLENRRDPKHNPPPPQEIPGPAALTLGYSSKL